MSVACATTRPAAAAQVPPETVLRWLPQGSAPGAGHLQTIWPALFARAAPVPLPAPRRVRWTTPDGDFVDVDFLVDRPVPAAGTPALPGAQGAGVPLLALFHGLEGSSASHYARAHAAAAQALGWRCAVPHFRGCSGTPNLAPRAYHSGDHAEIDWMLGRLQAAHAGPIVAVGVSLGGNALLRWAEEAGRAAARVVRAVAAVSAPVDLTAAGHAIGTGLNAQLYARAFLRTMKPKALRTLARHPGLFDGDRLRAARSLHAFDDVFTAPLHGFRGADDYWTRASAGPRLPDIAVPALLVHARNDPFVPIASVPPATRVGRHVQLWQPANGGHAGFGSGAFPGHVLAMPRAVAGWLAAHL